MANVLGNLVGFETGGLEETVASAGTPDATEETVVRFGIRSCKLAGAATSASIDIDTNVAGTTGSTTNHIVGFAFQTNDITPTTDVDILEAQTGAGGKPIGLRFEATTGDLIVLDNASNEVGTITAPFTVNTWHYIELWHENTSGAGANSDCEVFIDEISKITITNEDFDLGATISFYRFTGGTTTNEDIYIDDFYTLFDTAQISTSADVFGDFAVKGFQNTAEDATDQGDTLADGTWALVSETPGNSGTSNDASYVDTGNLTGSTIMDEGSRAGPSGDSDVTGATIKGAKFISNLKRGTGGGRTHTILHGNSGDGVTATADLELTASYVIHEVLSELASIVPTESESFQMGFSKSATAGQDIFCGDQWAMLGYVPASGPAAPIPSLVMAPYVPA